MPLKLVHFFSPFLVTLSMTVKSRLLYIKFLYSEIMVQINLDFLQFITQALLNIT